MLTILKHFRYSTHGEEEEEEDEGVVPQPPRRSEDKLGLNLQSRIQ